MSKKRCPLKKEIPLLEISIGIPCIGVGDHQSGNKTYPDLRSGIDTEDTLTAPSPFRVDVIDVWSLRES